MPRGRKAEGQDNVGDYRHKGAKRKNNPPAGIAPTYEAHERQVEKYAYDPHLDPQLVWAGKAEHTSFEVDTVSLHIHERVSTRAILESVQKPEPQLALFGNNELPADQQIEFYKHDVGWANRLILGDSLLVMNSMLVKEGMSGKVQCIYIDPPYGIKYASNMQARTDRRDVKDKDDDLTREPEQIKAYRDTWKLGIHSYLTYLRDRLLLAKDLLTEPGSIFVQINDENLHIVRGLVDEVYGRENFCSQVAFLTTGGQATGTLASVCDHLLWYARDKKLIKYRQIYRPKVDVGTAGRFQWLETSDHATLRELTDEEAEDPRRIPDGAALLVHDNITSQGLSGDSSRPFDWRGKVYHLPANSHWKTTPDGMKRLATADRLMAVGATLRYKRYLLDFNVSPFDNVWDDTAISGFGRKKQYVVETNTKVIERCIQMTTDPGDLVFDPTCGSGTAAFCAEKWGRRWITCDTSRVALAIARQRLLTGKYDYSELQDADRGPAAGFKYEAVPHIMLESVAKNPEIDAIVSRHQPGIDAALKSLNGGLRKKWQEWEVPREVDKTWDKAAKEAHREFFVAKRMKQHEIDATIQRNAPQETLYDRPLKKSGIVRVSGPFTVEAIPAPAVEAPDAATPVPQFETSEAEGRISDRAGDYLSDMINLLKLQGGVIFPKGRKMELANIRAVSLGFVHAEAETGRNGKTQKVAIGFGPQHGPVTAYQVQESTPAAKMNGYDILLFCGFSFDPEARALIQKTPVKGLTVEFVNVAPDVLIGDLLKTGRASQIFTAYGEPDVKVSKGQDDTYVVELAGVDIYDPLTGKADSSPGEDASAWFLDTDYDGMTFHICQAFFPGDKDAWDKLQRALRAQIEPETFEQMRGTKSFPFQPGKHKRIAVKVIDFRGNEVPRVMGLATGKER